MQGTSESICRILRSFGIGSHFKPQNLLRNHLVHPKDKTEPLDYSGTIYHIKCKQCDAGYVGETERPLRIRLAEHKRPSNKSSAVQAHAKKHEIAWDKMEVLDREQDWFPRIVKEAINIRRFPSSLNKDGGRHDLSQVYAPLTSPSQ